MDTVKIKRTHTLQKDGVCLWSVGEMFNSIKYCSTNPCDKLFLSEMIDTFISTSPYYFTLSYHFERKRWRIDRKKRWRVYTKLRKQVHRWACLKIELYFNLVLPKGSGVKKMRTFTYWWSLNYSVVAMTFIVAQ